MSPRVLWIALRLLCLLGLSAVVSSSAEASTGLRIVGDAKFRVVAERRVASWLAGRGHNVTDKALGRPTLAALDECYLRNEPQCANKVFVENGDADLFLYITFEVVGEPGRRRTVRGTLWLLRKIGTAEKFSRECVACEEEATLAMIDDLVTEVGAFEARAGGLKIASDPAGATVELDGERLGITPFEKELRPGSYTLVLRRDGYRDEERTVVVEPSRVAEQVIDLRPLAQRGPRRRKIAAFGAAGVAVALAVGGGVLLALDEGSSCAPNKTECFYSRPYGIAAFVGAGAFLGVAGYLWVTTTAPSRTATIGPSSRGVVVGWGARF
ncbi:MAG: PEGA domain-containing protein [Kofleriaceae bacterium]